MHGTVPAAACPCINYLPWLWKLTESLELYIPLAGFVSPKYSKTLIVLNQHPQKHLPPGLGEHTELRIPKRSWAGHPSYSHTATVCKIACSNGPQSHPMARPLALHVPEVDFCVVELIDPEFHLWCKADASTHPMSKMDV